MENTENKFEGLYIIGYGLSGGFGGAQKALVIGSAFFGFNFSPILNGK